MSTLADSFAPRTWARLILAMGLCVGFCAAPGCTRKFYRKSADKEVSGVLTEKNRYDAWRIEDFHVYPDPRARFADPNNPDRPPMPPDDPAAANLSPNPQKPPHKAGVGNPEGIGYLELLAAWDAENRANRPADSQTRRSLTPGLAIPPKGDPGTYEQRIKSDERPFLISLDQACELALLNSREFQDRREDLYLAALPVTLERFAFAAQFFAIEQVIRESTGENTPEGKGQRWRSNSTVGVTQLFPTGALLLFRLANQVVLNMSDVGGARLVTPAQLSLDLTQPLLRDGGVAVTLEPLTQSERNLLYVIRAYARFRKEFFVAIAAGGLLGSNFSPTGPLAFSGSAVAEGYMSTLLRTALLDNAQQNVLTLEFIRALYRALLEGGDVSQLQVDQVELSLLNGRANVLLQTNIQRDALDRFKIQLGVPVSVPLAIEQSPFKLLRAQQNRFLDIVEQFEALRAIVNRTDWIQEPGQLRARLRELVDNSPLVHGTPFAQKFPNRWSEAEKLTLDQMDQRRRSLMAERKKLLDHQTELQLAGQPMPAEEQLRLQAIQRDLDLFELEQSVRRFESKPWERPGLDESRKAAARATAYRDAVSDFVVAMGEARNERIEEIRKLWPDLPPVHLGENDLISQDLDRAIAAASEAALANRFDLMNARARVVDAWRRIAVRANSLMGLLNVQYHMDSFAPNTGSKPFDFDASRTRHQLILNGELPLVRQSERNDYRIALIAYQRARRTLQAAEDQVVAGVRQELRQLRVLAENYKIQQRAVELSYYQLENSLNVLQAPPRPSQAQGGAASGGSGSGGGDSGSQAALTRQVLDSVSSLLQAQNQLITVYQNYLVTRMLLYRDLELMPLDPRGVWLDDDLNNPSPNQPRPETEPSRDAGPERVPAPRPIPGVLPPPTDA